jgi:hypothetical protein
MLDTAATGSAAVDAEAVRNRSLGGSPRRPAMDAVS